MTRRTSACPLDCPDYCALAVEVEGDRVVGVDGAKGDPITDGFVCAKVRNFPRHMYGEQRIAAPAERIGPKGEGRFREISWDRAFEILCDRIRAVRDRHGGQAILPCCYGGSNGYLTQDSVDLRLFRRLGATRLRRTLCAVPSTEAARALYGRMPGVAYPDYLHAELIVVWGCNPAATGIHLVPHIHAAQRRGARLVVIDPRATPLARRADLHIAPLPGTDLPLALAVIHRLFATGAADLEFLAGHATGAEALRARAAEWSVERAAQVCAIDPATITELADRYATASPAVIRCGWGVERNRNGGSAVAAILALPAVAGKFGLRGGGYTMSQTGAFAPDSEAAIAEPAPATRSVALHQLGRALCRLDQPPIELLFVYNANPLVTAPVQEQVRRGLARDDLFTVVFDAIHTDTADYADLLVPATTFPEHRELHVGYGNIKLADAPPVVAPFGQARPNYRVFAELVRRLGLDKPGDPETPDQLIDALLAGHDDRERIVGELAGGEALAAVGRTPIQLVDVFPRTPSGKIELFPDAVEATPPGLYHYTPADPELPLALISPAAATTTNSTFGQLRNRPGAVELHPDDAAPRGIETGTRVRVFNQLGEVRCEARVTAEVRRGVVVMSKGLWLRHTDNRATSNALIPDHDSDLDRGACFNDARVEVQLAPPTSGHDHAPGPRAKR